MKVYSEKRAARILGLSLERIRSFARSGVLRPERGPGGESSFSFQDLSLLRAAKGLLDARVSPASIRQALLELGRRIPADRPLSALQIFAEGNEVVVRDGEAVWNPVSGQARFSFGFDRPSSTSKPTSEDESELSGTDESLGPDEWLGLGRELEAVAPTRAREAYRRALELDPGHADTRIRLGLLLHEIGELGAAEAHFRLALTSRPGDAAALFHLAVCLEDQGKVDQAMLAFLRTIDSDPACASVYRRMNESYAETDPDGTAPAED